MTNPTETPLSVRSAKSFTSTQLGWIVGVLSTIFFSAATPLLRNAIVRGVDPATLLIGRLGLASLLMGGAWAIFNPQALRFSRRQLGIVLLLGVFSGASTLCYSWSLISLESSMAVMIFAINPVASLAILALGGERLTLRQLLRLLLALLGVYLLVGPSGKVDLFGALLVVVSIVLWAVQMVGVQWYLQGRDAGAISFYIALASTIVIAGWWWVRGTSWYIPDNSIWISIIVLAVVSTFLARLFFFTAIQRIGSGQMSLLMPLETMLSVTWSLLFLGEHLNLWQWLGAALIVTSALLAVERLSRTPKQIAS